jgi:centrosomal protein CEP44
MSTGDLKNNLRKLQVEITAIKYEKDIDMQSLSKGIASTFLPIYHYAFIDYSRQVAEQIANLNVELFGKSDLRFIEAMYKVLRELFTYKPPITKVRACACFITVH